MKMKLTPKQQQLLALIPDGGILLWRASQSHFAVINTLAGNVLADIGKGWGPSVSALYYRRRLNHSSAVLPPELRFEWRNARQFSVSKEAS